ncbi:MAG: hypothetical protein H7843_03015 [Nitrospirota bacterium]
MTKPVCLKEVKVRRNAVFLMAKADVDPKKGAVKKAGKRRYDNHGVDFAIPHDFNGDVQNVIFECLTLPEKYSRNMVVHTLTKM